MIYYDECQSAFQDKQIIFGAGWQISPESGRAIPKPRNNGNGLGMDLKSQLSSRLPENHIVECLQKVDFWRFT
jgi:hypothetical protein